MSFDTDLIAYYDAEARGGHRDGHGTLRGDLLERFHAILTAERRSCVVDVGSGPGLDAERLQRDGLSVTCVDLAHANIRRARMRGVTGITGSLYDLPLRTGAFDALWSMSTFVHVPHDRFDAAMRELRRVVRRGAPLGIGTWGGFDFEGVPEFGELRPYRFFSLAAHDRWREMLSRHGELEVFETFASSGDHGWEYQFAILR